MSDVNMIPNDIVARRRRQYEQRQDAWFAARWMEQSTELALERARERIRLAAEERIRAELALQEVREVEFRQSAQGIARTRFGAFYNLRRCAPASQVVGTSERVLVSSASQTEPVVLPPVSSLLHRVFTDPPASPTLRIFTGEPVATSTPTCDG